MVRRESRYERMIKLKDEEIKNLNEKVAELKTNNIVLNDLVTEVENRLKELENKKIEETEISLPLTSENGDLGRSFVDSFSFGEGEPSINLYVVPTASNFPIQTDFMDEQILKAGSRNNKLP